MAILISEDCFKVCCEAFSTVFESERSLNLSSVSSFISSTSQHCNKASCCPVRPVLGHLPITVQSLHKNDSRNNKKVGQNYGTS